jgi:diguanylate cyclase (GGDEF)-like protein
MHEIGLVETASRLAAVAIEHRCLHDNLRRQATRDRLTGLPNRSVFEETLADKLQKDTPVALLWIDLDRFKEINDSLGHRIGDALLLQVAGRLSESTPDAALLARIGGDEFAIILDAACRAEAEDCAREIASGLQAVFQVEDYELFVTASVGISMYPEHAGSAVELQKKADAAMYCAKGRGKNGFSFYDVRLERGARERLELETGLRRALQNGEMRLFYQPQVDLDGRPLAMEALLRWLHPKRGIVAPADFIPIAEETGLIVPLGSWVIREACRQCADWRSAGFDALRVAVNVSTLQFYFSDLVEIVRTALDTSNLPSACLELELTESLIMRNSDESTRELQRLRALGVTVAIDDFGTGYSSLSYLQNLPIDLLKIDRSFLNDVEVVSRAAVIQAITSLAHGLGLRVAAEGIETESQLDSIRRIGVDLAQGYLFGKPMSVEDASAYLKGRG